MRKRKIGALEVTVVGVGCNNFGRQLDVDRTRQVVHAALDAGVTFFDTADRYGDPKTASETVLGEVLGARRDEIVLATKFGRFLDDARPGGASAAYVRSATEASLRRLRTDHIDLLQVHIPDPDTPIAETLGALAELRAEGKVREIGASNFSVGELREARAAATAADVPGFVSTQDALSMLDRTAESATLAECERAGMAFLPYQPLFNGLLTGRYRAGEQVPAGSRIGGKDARTRAALLSDRNFQLVADLTAFAQERGHTILELAFAWLLAHPAIPSVIAGVSSPAQVASNVASTQWELTEEERGAVARILSPVGSPA
ncbi:putative aldo/keto reductase [Actinacidiphila reveromycinica]|uniref:Putative aldo/keto reductase n=1 Tax=Actinacidiphila reveromycinica TaxID=659352 RepID=A0A7U3UYT9_9ACTN|nr:aldo/keto reductase [Streptomyces sp. SN-593]BBB01364.1 putative aldo/keto reductase [Streptomyces sp. SN-593]